MGHFLFFLKLISLNLLRSKSKIINFPTEFFPIPKISFITSTDCNDPAIPAIPPTIPQS